MTDEGRRGDPMDEVELAQAIKDAARAAREMFIALLQEGFTEEQALKLVAGVLGGRTG